MRHIILLKLLRDYCLRLINWADLEYLDWTGYWTKPQLTQQGTWLVAVANVVLNSGRGAVQLFLALRRGQRSKGTTLWRTYKERSSHASFKDQHQRLMIPEILISSQVRDLHTANVNDTAVEIRILIIFHHRLQDPRPSSSMKGNHYALSPSA